MLANLIATKENNREDSLFENLFEKAEQEFENLSVNINTVTERSAVCEGPVQIIFRAYSVAVGDSRRC
jgi:hypothetical protein